MSRAIGVTTAEHIAIGLVEDNKLAGALRIYPGEDVEAERLLAMPAEDIARLLREQIAAVAQGQQIDAIGVGFPGVIREGIIEESPNLQQLKGTFMADLLCRELGTAGIRAPLTIYNDADIVAAGLAATRGHLDRFVRVWTLGQGIGFGVYPTMEGIWEGGHMVVSLDPAERFCGCGGVGHLEGIMGHRAMRLRFLDLEPDEVFEYASQGDSRCVDFVKYWHRALAAATATSIHMAGPGKFFLTGRHARRVDLNLLNGYLHDMVKMSPLQGYVFEIVPGGDEIAVIGAGVNAIRAL
ncbi:MAG TPA: ROK family protein [Bryobacteraceae bacterium]|nr:ROK family protein [Bryobacteraceae bacterium]